MSKKIVELHIELLNLGCVIVYKYGACLADGVFPSPLYGENM